MRPHPSLVSTGRHPDRPAGVVGRGVARRGEARFLRRGSLPPVHRWKRAFDVSIILVTSPLWLPLMLGLAALIKVVSAGPVLFRQERVGLAGRRFLCLKFRTMRVGADTRGHEQYLAELMASGRPMTKLDGHDPRLIPLAGLLRSTGLDELPQLVNVLRGEMSLVGPRPCTVREFDGYRPHQQARFGAMPGLTGLWQVSGKNRTTFDEMVELDIRYLHTQCLSLDLGILLRTPLVLVRQVVETTLERRAELAVPGAAVPVSVAIKTTAKTASSSRFLAGVTAGRRVHASGHPDGN